MLANYLKTALRNLLRQRTHLLINSGGLAVGMACALLMSLYIRFELSYDRFHTHHDRIYRVTSDTRARQPVPLGPLLLDSLPAVEATTSVKRSFQPLIIHGDERFFTSVHFVDANFFEFFDFPLVRGETGTVLTRPHTMVISRQLAERHFGDQDPVGARLSWDGLWDFEVTGVADVATNSHFQFEILASVSTTDVTPDFVSGKDQWSVDSGYANRHIYLRLAEGQSADGLARQALDLVEDHVGADRVDLFERQGGLRLQPLADIHLHSQLAGELGTNGQIQQVYLAAAIALFVLLIACVNYVNLATARSTHRAHEVGVRKALGARRGQLIAQFLGESSLLALSSLALALCVGALSLPTFARFSTADLSLTQLLEPMVL
ncbi:MAG: ABC transporter permease, partial [Candidatus Latescibacteria bacterium]|nr:ABC transporter permease [Candidatus Latescibacterota bacterium]